MITLHRVTPRRSVDLALVAVAAAWGSSYLAAKDVVDPDGVVAFLAIRFALAPSVGLSSCSRGSAASRATSWFSAWRSAPS